MPVQFDCKKCHKWIEVDTEHAGGKAICPFCQEINDVPKGSEPPMARPAGETATAAEQRPYKGGPAEPTLSEPPEIPVSKPRDTREVQEGSGRIEPDQGRFDAERVGLPTGPRSGRLMRAGMLGLVGTVASIVLMLVPLAAMYRHLPTDLKQQFLQPEQKMTPEQAQEFQKKVMDEGANIARQHPWIGSVGFLGMLLWVTSLVVNLSVVFSAGMHRRGYAWAGLMVNVILLFPCLCSSIIQRFMGS